MNPLSTIILIGGVAVPGRLLGRDKFAAAQDSYCGFCIIAMYFLYLTVTKGALSVFDCSKNQDGVYILDAEPSIKCYEVRRSTHTGFRTHSTVSP